MYPLAQRPTWNVITCLAPMSADGVGKICIGRAVVDAVVDRYLVLVEIVADLCECSNLSWIEDGATVDVSELSGKIATWTISSRSAVRRSA